MPAKIAETLQLSKKYPNMQYNILGQTGLGCSAIAFGSYRVHISLQEHQQALEHALLSGINLIDTSSNYADGGSEELIGAVLKRLSGQNKINREEMIIVSKVGYLQGQNYALSQQLKQQGRAFPELVEYSSGLEHCMHPDFISDQLSRSLNRLQADTIDVYLLHNPEYYLLNAQKQGLDLDTARQEYYRRIEQAFLHLEIEARNGRIQYYGISSNAFPVNQNRYDFTSLEKCLKIAESISHDHHFRVVQFPMNISEQGAICEENQAGNNSVLEFAEKNNLAVLINRPLNAFGDKLQRLVSLTLAEEFNPDQLNKALDSVFDLEQLFSKNIVTLLKTDEKTIQELSGFFASGIYLKTNYERLGPYWAWIENQARFLAEQISFAVQRVNEIPDKDDTVIKWLDQYVESFNNVLDTLTLFYGSKTAALNDSLFKKLKTSVPLLSQCQNLQHLAVNALRSTKGISSVLIGMRQQTYVDDFLHEITNPVHQNLNKQDWLKIKSLQENI